MTRVFPVELVGGPLDGERLMLRSEHGPISEYRVARPPRYPHVTSCVGIYKHYGRPGEPMPDGTFVQLLEWQGWD